MQLMRNATRQTPAEQKGRVARSAVLSALVPGLGQFAQGRWAVGFVHLATVVGYVAVAYGGGLRWLLLAVAWNVWSAIDAGRQEAASTFIGHSHSQNDQ